MLKPIEPFQNQPKEYNLFPPPVEKLRVRRPGQAFIFSEKDLPGYKPRTFAWDDMDEEGTPGQRRSFLYERHKRELKKKENKGRFVPYTRRPIPKQTAITGTIGKEFEAVPVKNEEYFVLENKQAEEMLKPPEREQAIFVSGEHDPSRKHIPFMTMSDKASVLKVTPLLALSRFALTLTRTPKHANKHKRRTALLASTNMFSLTSYSNCSGSIVSGACVISKLRSINPKHICDRLWMRLLSCGKRATSMANGSSRTSTKVMLCCRIQLVSWRLRLRSLTWTSLVWRMI